MENKIKNYKIFLILLLIMIVLLFTFIVTIGSVSIKGSTVWKIIINKILGEEVFVKDWKNSIEIIVWNIRIPRIIASLLSGGALTLVGILMQCLTKNPLASPYILGISSGASTGAVLAIIFFNNIMFSVPLGAFILGSLTAFIVFFFSEKDGFSNTKLVLTGVAISSLFSGLTTLIITIAPKENDVRDALFWMSGSLSGIEWENIPIIGIVLIVATILIYPRYREMNILVTGDENALTLGVNVKKIRIFLMLISTLVTGIIVSNTGIIGFVGLIIPHITRVLVGGNHKKVIPLAILLGGLFLMLTDTVTRVIFSSQEIPIGVITSIIGVPFFLQMLRKRGYKFRGE